MINSWTVVVRNISSQNSFTLLVVFFCPSLGVFWVIPFFDRRGIIFPSYFFWFFRRFPKIHVGKLDSNNCSFEFSSGRIESSKSVNCRKSVLVTGDSLSLGNPRVVDSFNPCNSFGRIYSQHSVDQIFGISCHL